MVKAIILVLFLMVVTGCGKQKIYVSEELRQYEVVAIHRPKRFSVDLRDVRTMKVFERESKRTYCYKWRKNELGEIVTVRTIYYRYEGSEDLYVQLENINEHFCG